MFFLPRLKRINTDAFIAASTITQFTSFSEDEIHAIQFAECLAEECNPGVTFIHNLRMKFTDVFSVDILCDRKDIQTETKSNLFGASKVLVFILDLPCDKDRSSLSGVCMYRRQLNRHNYYNALADWNQ